MNKVYFIEIYISKFTPCGVQGLCYLPKDIQSFLKTEDSLGLEDEIIDIYILLHPSGIPDILQLHILEESILISRGSPMQSSTFFRNKELNEVSKSVLRLISNKMYPLNQQKMNKIIKCRRKQKLTKANTEPNEPISLVPTSKHLSRNKSTFQEFEQRTMGEHFNQLQTRELMLSRIQNRDYELMTQKINDFIWAKRQEIIINQAKKKIGKEVELQRQANYLKKCHSRRNSSNIQHCLVKLRKKLKEEYRRESEVFQTPICRFSDMQEHEKPVSNVNFFQQNEGIERVMQRYPIRDSSRVKVKEDPNKQFESDFLQEIKNSQSNDKYTRMRISINHRKIVSLK